MFAILSGISTFCVLAGGFTSNFGSFGGTISCSRLRSHGLGGNWHAEYGGHVDYRGASRDCIYWAGNIDFSREINKYKFPGLNY